MSKEVKKKATKQPKRKTPQPSTKQSFLPNIVTHTEWYKYNYTDPEKPVSENFLQKLGQGLIAYIEHDYNCLTLRYYFNKARVFRSQVARWTKRSPMFRAYVDMGKQLLAEKREQRMGIVGDIDKQVYMYTQAYYCSVTREMMELRAELSKKKEEDRHQVFHIVRDLGDGKPETVTWAKKNKDTNEEK
jgi:hypothetical protein